MRGFGEKHGIAWREVVVEDDVGERTNLARRAFGDIIEMPHFLLALPFKSFPPAGSPLTVVAICYDGLSIS